MRKTFLCVVVLFLSLNMFFQIPTLIKYYNFLKLKPHISLRREFIVFGPYLDKVPIAGYMSCANSPHPLIDPEVMRPFQQARFVLAPTVLDYVHPLDHAYILLQCPDALKQMQLAKQFSAKIIFQTKKAALLERGQR
jgi:hypothetical protein